MATIKSAEENITSPDTVGNSSPDHIAPPSLHQKNIFARIRHDPWFQIILISFIAFCNPGMYNALTGMGGSGQVDSTVSANANVATHAATAGAALVVVGTLYKYLGPRLSLLIGGWTYALYAGALLNSIRVKNGGPFVIASGALLGLGAAFFWVAQGTIMVTYTNDQTRGRAIGVFWVIFNLGGTIGSLASFGLNYHSKSGTVTDSTYIAYIVIMLFGWALSVLVCSTESLSEKYHGHRIAQESKAFNFGNLKSTVIQVLRIVFDWRNLCLYPMFYNANVFYSYQQNDVNGLTFN
jgi:MFS family permease